MPFQPTSSALATEVTRCETPVAVPTSPLARSRTRSSNSAVTIVGSAIPRTFPLITPVISSTMNSHSHALPGSRHSSAGVTR
ncbi:Uncharacterised protein [Nocardia farcinica]|nr:Uncharacterised protein [Nocardia farcinica]